MLPSDNSDNSEERWTDCPPRGKSQVSRRRSQARSFAESMVWNLKTVQYMFGQIVILPGYNKRITVLFRLLRERCPGSGN
jgi:hypothetical protein